MRFRPPAISLGMQIRNMEICFPEFRYSRVHNIPTWFGHLKPFNYSENYYVKIEYRFDNQFSKRPRVWIVSPDIVPNAPHVYPGNDLCLYFPKDRTWSPYKHISAVIVPLTTAWLGFYEIWLQTRKWYGPEAPHGKHGKK